MEKHVEKIKEEIKMNTCKRLDREEDDEEKLYSLGIYRLKSMRRHIRVQGERKGEGCGERNNKEKKQKS